MTNDQTAFSQSQTYYEVSESTCLLQKSRCNSRGVSISRVMFSQFELKLISQLLVNCNENTLTGNLIISQSILWRLKVNILKMEPMNQKISLGGKNTEQHINAYIEYCNLVGDHGGKLMDEREFEEYKKNYSKLAQNRVFNGWFNPKGLECKVVGPSTKCFCDHYYKNHDFLQPKEGKVKCKMQGCQCANFYYLPIYGSQDFKCSCKHSYQQHHVNKRNCKNCQCKDFTSTWTCPCGSKFSEHKNTVERKQEREQRGASSHPINGGIVSYSSMLDGADRYQNDVNQYLKENPDKKVEVRDMKLKKPNEELKGKTTAAVLYDTPLRFGK